MRVFKSIKPFFHQTNRNIRLFQKYLWFYSKKKVTKAIVNFEDKKDVLVKFLLMKRGRYNRPFLHIATMGVLAVGVLVGPFLADTYPIFSSKAQAINGLGTQSPQEESITADENV